MRGSFRTGGIGFQVHIHHRGCSSALSGSRAGVVYKAVFGIVYGGLPGLRGELLPHFLYRRAVCVRRLTEAYFEVIRNFIVVAYVQCDLAILLVLDIALLVGITGAEVEAVPGGSTRDADIVVGDKSGLEDFILPVGIASSTG